MNVVCYERGLSWTRLFWKGSASGMPTPEICFFPGQLRRTILPKELYGDSLSVGESDKQPSNCEADTLPLSYRRPTEIPT